MTIQGPMTVGRVDAETGHEHVTGALAGFPGWNIEVEVDDANPPAILSVRVYRGPHPIADAARRMGAEVHVSARARPEPIEPSLTVEMLRSVSLDDVREAVNRHRRGRLQLGRLPDPTKMASRGDRYYATIAAHYVRLVGAGESAPVAELADRWGVKREAVRDLLTKCRRRGLLTAKHGHAGGDLTDKAREALARPKGT